MFRLLLRTDLVSRFLYYPMEVGADSSITHRILGSWKEENVTSFGAMSLCRLPGSKHCGSVL